MYRIFVLIVALVQLTSAARSDVLATCSKPGSNCIGYNNAEDCSADVSKCEFAFASFTKGPSDNYHVQLVGKGNGWVSLAISDQESFAIRGSLALICVNSTSPTIQILQLTDMVSSDSGKPFVVDNSALATSVSNGTVELAADGWTVCEFDLSSTPRHSDKTFYLKNTSYFMGLATSVQLGFHGPNERNAGTPHYHGPYRGSSKKTIDLFKKL